jgi:hypothetical protein
MTTYALRLQVIRDFGDPFSNLYGHTFEIAEQMEHTVHPETLHQIITEQLQASLHQIIEAHREQRPLVEGARPPQRTLTPDDILALRDTIDNPPRGWPTRITATMLEPARETFHRTGQNPTFIATDEAHTENTFLNTARFWTAPTTPTRPPPAASHALWPLTAPDA